MWLLNSRGRPESCREAIEAFARHGSTPGVLYVHGDPRGYDFDLPEGWVRHAGEHGVVGALRWFYAAYPDLPWYGWLADDNRPKTPCFDRKMIETTGMWCHTWCSGGQSWTKGLSAWKAASIDRFSHNNPEFKRTPPTTPSAMMWGGEALRLLGWLVPPYVDKATCDTAWRLLAQRGGFARYRYDVVVEHFHWANGLRERDATDDALGEWQHDIPAMNKWLAEKMPALAKKVRNAKRLSDEHFRTRRRIS